ncbi:MAG: tetratricopeptide repeat protein, partial [Dokdonella sp.]
PTIAEIGGRVRITAEVIDPHTQTTVYSESADGTGAESVLPSLDAINSRLRVRLGEALATVSQDSLPLEKVATKNLDALRAYSLGYKAIAAGEIDGAIALYESAIHLDDGFARAHIELADALSNLGKRTEAQARLRAALALEDRILPRDRMIAEARLAQLASPVHGLEKWKALAAVYPDLFMAQGLYGYYAWQYTNDYETAIAATRRNAVAQNPHRGIGLYLLGTLYLGNEQYADSHKSFLDADAVGARFENVYYAALFAAQRQYPRMQQVLGAGKAPDGPTSLAHNLVLRAGVAIDRARWSDAHKLVDEAKANAAAIGETHFAGVESVGLTVSVLSESKAQAKVAIEQYLVDRVEKPLSPDIDPPIRDGRILFNAWLAARYGEPATARATMTQASSQARSGNYPVLSSVLGVLEAELALREGNARSAVDQLRPLLDDKEPYAAHLVLMDAYTELADFASAREHARWLAKHRGRAYTEIGASMAWIPFNIAQSTHALLAQAELSVKLDDRDAARSALAEFLDAWPDHGGTPTLHARVKAVEAALDPAAVPK